MEGKPNAWRLGFLLGPRINAGGRIGDAGLGARLLMERDPAAAATVARELDRLNGERQALEKATLTLAEEAAEEALARIQPSLLPRARDRRTGIPACWDSSPRG